MYTYLNKLPRASPPRAHPARVLPTRFQSACARGRSQTNRDTGILFIKSESSDNSRELNFPKKLHFIHACRLCMRNSFKIEIQCELHAHLEIEKSAH